MNAITNKHGLVKDMSAKFRTDKNGPITYSIKVPNFTATAIMDVKLPRMFAGEISPKYIGMTEKPMPVLKPHINLDMYNSYITKKRWKIKYIKLITLEQSTFRTQGHFFEIFAIIFMLKLYLYLKIVHIFELNFVN